MEVIFNIIWTLSVAILTMLAEFIATNFILMRSTLNRIAKKIDSDKSQDSIIDDVKNDLRSLSESSIPLWGAELSAVALSLDFAALGIWISDKTHFSFFSRWNTSNVEYEIPIWLLLFMVHFIALLIAIIFKQLYSDSIRVSQQKRGWLYVSNLIGFMTLFSTFTVLTNTL